MLKDGGPTTARSEQFADFQIGRPRLRQLRRDHRPQRQLLPLPQLRQFDGLLVAWSVNRDAKVSITSRSGASIHRTDN